MVTTFKEGPHAAEFILSEAAGHLSRDNITIGENQTIEPGTVLVNGGGGYTGFGLGDAVPDPLTGVAIAMYGVVTGPGETAQISAITRAAEVNGHCLIWESGVTADRQAAVAAMLAATMVIVRGFPDLTPASPSP